MRRKKLRAGTRNFYVEDEDLPSASRKQKVSPKVRITEKVFPSKFIEVK